MGTEGSDTQAWVLTLASAIACVLGSLFIFIDLLVRLIPGHTNYDLQEDKSFLVGGLSLGAGVLLFTALNKILPEGLQYLETKPKHGKHILDKKYAPTILMCSFVAGVVICIALNTLLHRITPESIIHCGDEEGHAHSADHEHSTHHEVQNSERRPTESRVNSENSPLLGKTPTRKGSSLSRCKHSESSVCAGFTNPCDHDSVCCCHTSQSSEASCGHQGRASGSATNEHHHHVTQERHDLMRVGLQTAFAISIHKLPEGFITFMANHRDATVGFTIFLALGIHNIIEGFTIAFPLYLAFHSRTKAIAATFVLGGLSQPLGAVIAWAATKTKFGRLEDNQPLDIAYGVLFGATSGFMSVIACSLLAQAVRNDTRDGYLFTICFFIGIAIIGFSDALTP